MVTNRLANQQLKVVIVGHVDHGKSTLIGRLLYDTDSLPDGKAEEIKRVSEKRGTDAVEWSFVLDAFQAERDQAVTIDTTQIWFSTQKRDYVIIDAPGHREFLKNMVSGAASADAAILVVDADEGIQEQTRRHAYLLSLLGLKQVTVVLNKMDLIKYDQDRFDSVAKDIKDYLKSIHLQAGQIIPISARQGDMIASRGEHMAWYQGHSLLEALDMFDNKTAPDSLPLRFPVQDVYRQDSKRILVGRVETGTVKQGDKILFSPTNETAIVKSVEVWPHDAEKTEASAGESIGITLDQKIFVERGHVGSHDVDLPLLSNIFQANIFWLSHKPLKVGDSLTVHYGTSEANVTVQSIDRVVDTQDLEQTAQAAAVERNAVAEVTLRARDLVPLDSYAKNPHTGRLVLYDGYDIVGGGNINMDRYPDQRINAPKAKNIYEVDSLTGYNERVMRNGHHGGIFWFTGLSGAGKSTLAMRVERELFHRGYNTYVLDGDNVRHGLCKDLGFSPKDRAENIRRIGHVAALQSDAGLVTITAFISPYQVDRDRAREAAPQHFHEIYVKADLETCESRDPKGLYKKARDGEIKDFTGIGSPYEPPENPELIVDTQHNDVDDCVAQIVSYIEKTIKVDIAKESKKQDKALHVS
ncbi:MAG: adenylyl-sulfate kinase [Alphaproteobacteria bacterium]|jgi:bifunctional enzyme CysN/CysC|nr:adenylyl-sulfate kinase [Alphaproteobacteria bacterium]MDP7223383.1 adenylyl-sulfate kinase [Alphaproteobacteria bacterium]